MKKLLLAVLPLALYGQVLVVDTTLIFPTYVFTGLYLAELNKLYISAGGSFFYAVNCSTYAVDTVASGIGRGRGFISYNWRRKKLYFMPESMDQLAVVDAVTGSLLRMFYPSARNFWGIAMCPPVTGCISGSLTHC
jgi:hypothetical protein